MLVQRGCREPQKLTEMRHDEEARTEGLNSQSSKALRLECKNPNLRTWQMLLGLLCKLRVAELLVRR